LCIVLDQDSAHSRSIAAMWRGICQSRVQKTW